MTVQRTFAAGEVSPALFGRVDVDRWRSALETCRNFIVLPEGGITARQGFQHGGTISGITPENMRAVPFEFGPSDSHMLLFDGTWMYVCDSGFYQSGYNVVFDCTLSKAASPWTVTHSSAHGYTTGNTVTVIGVGDYTITVTGATTYTLDGSTGGSGSTTVNILNTTATTNPIKVAFACDQTQLRWVQSGDTLYVTDGANLPKKIVREYLDNGSIPRNKSWRISTAPMTPTIATGVAVTLSGGTGTQQSRYRVTYTDRDGIESAVVRTSTTTGTASLSGGLWNINATAHALLTNDNVEVTEDKFDANGTLVYKAGDLVRVVKVDADNFTVAGNTISVSGNFKYRKLGDSIDTSAASASPITIAWTSVANAEYYNIYREYGRYFSYIGSVSGLSFKDYGIVPDAKDNAIVGIDPTRSLDGGVSYNIPLTVGLFQQRLMYGGFSEDTERIVGSATGNYTSFDPAAEDSSGLDFTLGGRSVSNIKHMVEVGGRSIVLTATSEWVLRGSSTTGGLTPTAINARADSYYGTTDVPPALVGNSLLFVQKGGRVIRDAIYDNDTASLTSRDLTLWSKHLFGTATRRVAYQRSEQVVWVLLEDGSLLGLTYDPTQDVWGWHRHDIAQDVSIQDVCVISEDSRDRLYIVAKTAASDLTVMRLPLREQTLETVDDFYGYDLGYSYDGSIATGAWTLSGGTNWTTDETLTLTTTVTSWVFNSGWIGSNLLLRVGEERVYVEITGYTSATVLSVQPLTAVPTALRNVAVTDKGFAASGDVSFTGGPYIGAWTGRTLSGRFDGSVEASVTLSSGVMTLPYPSMRWQIGMPPVCRAKTLDLESTDKDSLMGDIRHVVKVRLRVVDSRGCYAGLSESTLEPLLPEYVALSNAPPTLQDGVKEILMDGQHDEDGSVIVAQEDGLPTTVTNVRVLFNAGEKS